mmetsp:Transcript_41280/g.90037  ORF Transcript_41280/g.90037 Transcript_41280/m.90037 type:complete len:394 (-) Transcript_41280:183-1364(-)
MDGVDPEGDLAGPVLVDGGQLHGLGDDQPILAAVDAAPGLARDAADALLLLPLVPLVDAAHLRPRGQLRPRGAEQQRVGHHRAKGVLLDLRLGCARGAAGLLGGDRHLGAQIGGLPDADYVEDLVRGVEAPRVEELDRHGDVGGVLQADVQGLRDLRVGLRLVGDEGLEPAPVGLGAQHAEEAALDRVGHAPGGVEQHGVELVGRLRQPEVLVEAHDGVAQAIQHGLGRAHGVLGGLRDQRGVDHLDGHPPDAEAQEYQHDEGDELVLHDLDFAARTAHLLGDRDPEVADHDAVDRVDQDDDRHAGVHAQEEPGQGQGPAHGVVDAAIRLHGKLRAHGAATGIGGDLHQGNYHGPRDAELREEEEDVEAARGEQGGHRVEDHAEAHHPHHAEK